LKFVAAERWRRSFGLIVHTIKKYYIELSRKRIILLTPQQRMANSIGNILVRNGLLRHFIEGNNRKDRRDGGHGRKLSTDWMTLRKEEDKGI
jgi:hypothetical protein